MSSQTQSTLPVIDFSKENLEKNTSTWASVSRDVQHALEEYGCFVVKNHKLPPELHNSVFSASKELHDLPMETKVQNPKKVLGSGYGRGFVDMPLLEYLCIENAATLEATEYFTNIMWPDGNNHFCETALSFSKQLAQICDTVLRMVFQNYGVESYCNSHLDSQDYLMRFMKYKAPMNSENNMGLNPHTDKNFISILDQNLVSGLEVQTKEGDWIGFKPFPSALVIVAGDGLTAWSNGRIPAALHRVTMNGNEDKYTVAMFAFQRGTVETPEELVDDEHPLQFKPFNHYEYLKYIGGEGMKHKNPLKVYCGVNSNIS